MGRTTVGYSQWFIMEVERAAREGWTAMMKDASGEPYYLWFKRGALKIARECPEGFQLATGERVPGNRDCAGITAWVHMNSTRLECLPE